MGEQYEPLFNRRRDIKLFNSINQELLHRIMNVFVTVYKISTDSQVNFYNESERKLYTKGIQIGVLLTRDEQVTENEDGSGPFINQTITTAFHREMMSDRGFYPEIGDIIEFNEAFYEINGHVENQLIGGHVVNNFSIVVTAHMVDRSRLNLENIRVGDNDK